ncbi:MULTISPECIES: hypothetical protein [unclassified Frankia]|uniref:hypothetical protein n=1 Tax=unclassified Frankia TaxID=2632575 RepID=UPI002AD57266|nr:MULTISPECIES: hypothetical protein [unclassified Frankia]
MSYYKFLRPAGTGPFTGYDWGTVPGTWVDAEVNAGAGDVVPCRDGIHACRVEDLPYWLTEELWRIDLDGPLVIHENKVVARRGRLGTRVEQWTRAAAREFSVACVCRVAYHAAAELRGAGLAALAESIEAAAAAFGQNGIGQKGKGDTLDEHARAGIEAAVQDPGSTANLLSAYVIDALESLDVDPPAALAYIAARAANQRSAILGDAAHLDAAHLDAVHLDDPYLDERRWQASWLATRLGLPTPAGSSAP